MLKTFDDYLTGELNGIRASGLFKEERILGSAQGAEIKVPQGDVLNFCANNYLGLGTHPEVLDAARESLHRWGYGLSSVRFICGTQQIHKELEKRIAEFLGFEDAILYASCFDANAGLFESLLMQEDAVISDQLNHASIIDGVRACKAKRFIYRHADMEDLENKLRASRHTRFRIIATDGVFSMDGDIAPLPEICGLAEKYDAIVMIDDSHATGVLGKSGRGTHEHTGVMGRIDIMTSTLGKAMGGASGGFTASSGRVVEMLRQRSRPYLFSNTVPPPVVATALRVLDLLSKSTELHDKLEANTKYFRNAMMNAGFDIKTGEHPIVPIMLYDARLAQTMAARLLEESIYVIGFFYPVVPEGQARIRVQVSATHERKHLNAAVTAFVKVGKSLGVLK